MIGSTGKERTNDGIFDGVDNGGRGKAASDGPEKVDEDQLWVKIVGDDFSVEHVDARPDYDVLRNAAACPLPGWITHESCRWSPAHNMWFFLPRKMCRDPYNPETTTFATLVMAVPEQAGSQDPWGKWDTGSDGDGVLMQEAPLPAMPLRGVSDFVFVPGTNDTHMFVLRTEVCLPLAVQPRMSCRRCLKCTLPVAYSARLMRLPTHNCRSGKMEGWYPSRRSLICSEMSCWKSRPLRRTGNMRAAAFWHRTSWASCGPSLLERLLEMGCRFAPAGLTM